MSSWCCSRMTSIQPRQGTASFLSTLALINCESIGEPFFRSFLSCRHLALILERSVGMFEKAFDISEHCISLANGATSAMRVSHSRTQLRCLLETLLVLLFLESVGCEKLGGATSAARVKNKTQHGLAWPRACPARVFLLSFEDFSCMS